MVAEGRIDRQTMLKYLDKSQDPNINLHEKDVLTCAQDSSKMSSPRLLNQSNTEEVADSFQQLSLGIGHKEENALSIFKPPLSRPPRSQKKLLILDINGVLVDIVSPSPKERKADINIARRAGED